MMELLRRRVIVFDHLHWERPMPTEEHGHTVETAVEARAGFLDRPVLAVLIASVVLIVVAFALTYAGVVNI